MFALFLLSVGLAMDAVAVSLVRGASGEHRVLRALEVGAFFGLAQALMPLLGWSLGVASADWVEAFDHWIAFGLLSFLGLRMLREAASPEENAPVKRARSHYAGLSAAAFATSVDAAAAGVTLPLLGQPLVLACVTIGGVTAILCAAAYWLGTHASRRMGALAEVLGGIILIGLGTRILVEHLGA